MIVDSSPSAMRVTCPPRSRSTRPSVTERHPQGVTRKHMHGGIWARRSQQTRRDSPWHTHHAESAVSTETIGQPHRARETTRCSLFGHDVGLCRAVRSRSTHHTCGFSACRRVACNASHRLAQKRATEKKEPPASTGQGVRTHDYITIMSQTDVVRCGSRIHSSGKFSSRLTPSRTSLGRFGHLSAKQA